MVSGCAISYTSNGHFVRKSVYHLGKGAECIRDVAVPTSHLRDTSNYFCKCPRGFHGNPYEECKPIIVEEACDKCGQL